MMAEPTNPEYQQFVDEGRQAIAQALADNERHQAQALQRLLRGEGDVRAGEPSPGE